MTKTEQKKEELMRDWDNLIPDIQIDTRVDPRHINESKARSFLFQALSQMEASAREEEQVRLKSYF